MASSLSLGLLLGFLFRVVFALEVTPGSSCATFCMDDPDSNAFDSSSSTTNTSDIVCKDADFSSNSSGIKFQNCLECLQKSKKKNGTESDLHWYLYNLRYTISTCLYSAPVAPSFDIDSPCVIDDACGDLRDSVTFDNLTSKADTTYGYCDADNGDFMGSKLKSCVSCLQSSGDQVYLSNFMVALEAGCEQKPDAGSLLSLSGTVFTNTTISITTPAVDITKQPAGAGSATMTKGTIAGIAIGTALFFLGAVALFVVYWRRQKEAKKQDDAAYRRSQFGSPDPFLPPQTKMSASLRSYSAQSQYENGRGTANGDYYDLVEKEARTTTTRLTYNFNPRGQARGPNSAMPTHQAYNPAAMSRTMPTAHNPLTPPPTHQRHTSTLPDVLSLQTHMNTGNANEYNGAMAHNQYCPPPPPPYNNSINASNTINTNTNPITNTNTNTHTRTHSRTHTMTTNHNAPALRPPSMATVPPPPAGPPPAKRRVPSLRVPSLSAPSVPKLRKPKQYTPPMIVIDAQPTDERTGAIAISGPVMSNDSRFRDIPLAGGVVYAERAPARENGGSQDMPIRSGKSTLYGM